MTPAEHASAPAPPERLARRVSQIVIFVTVVVLAVGAAAQLEAIDALGTAASPLVGAWEPAARWWGTAVAVIAGVAVGRRVAARRALASGRRRARAVPAGGGARPGVERRARRHRRLDAHVRPRAVRVVRGAERIPARAAVAGVRRLVLPRPLRGDGAGVPRPRRRSPARPAVARAPVRRHDRGRHGGAGGARRLAVRPPGLPPRMDPARGTCRPGRGTGVRVVAAHAAVRRLVVRLRVRGGGRGRGVPARRPRVAVAGARSAGARGGRAAELGAAGRGRVGGAAALASRRVAAGVRHRGGLRRRGSSSSTARWRSPPATTRSAPSARPSRSTATPSPSSARTGSGCSAHRWHGG